MTVTKKSLGIVFTSLLCAGTLVAAVACGGEQNEPEAAKYSVTYLAGATDATGSVPAESYAEGTPITLRDVDTFTREGYSFTKWSDGSVLYSAGETYYMPAHDVTFTAQWETIPPQPLPENAAAETVESIPESTLLTSNGAARANWFADYTDGGLKISAYVKDASVYTEGNIYTNDGAEVIFAKTQPSGSYTEKTVSVAVSAKGETLVKNLGTGASATVEGLQTSAKYLTLDGTTVAGYLVEITLPYSAAGISQEDKNAAVALSFTNASNAGNANTVCESSLGTQTDKVNTYIAVKGNNDFAENPYKSFVSSKTQDGSLDDWTAAEKSNPFVFPTADGRSVTVYAAKDETGVNIFYDVYHLVHKSTENDWWRNTNVEFRLGGDADKQYAVAANGFTANIQYYYFNTTAPETDGGMYHTVAEMFVPYSEINGYDAASEAIPANFYFKIDGVFGNLWYTGDWWRAEDGNEKQYMLITENGLKGGTVMTIDGEEDDWAGATWTQNKIEIGEGDDKKTVDGRAQWAATLEDDGLYLIVKLSQANIPERSFFADADGTGDKWWLNQNIEIQANDYFRQGKVVWVNGGAYYSGYIGNAAAKYIAGTNGANDTLIFEVFIARENILKVDADGTVRLQLGGQLFADATTTQGAWEVYASNATVGKMQMRSAVTFKNGDATVETVYVNVGEAIGNDIPAAPSQTGYTFEGWYVGQTKIDATYVPAESVTAVAKYAPVAPVIAFDKGDATGTDPVVTPVWNEENANYTVMLPAENPYANEGKQFDKWVVAVSGVEGTTLYALGASLTLAPGSTITVSVHWITIGATTYTVTYTAYEGAMPSSVTVEEGQTVVSLPTNPTRTGYRFVKWVFGSNNAEFTASTVVNGDMAVRGEWVKLVTLSFDLGFTTDTTIEDITVDEGATVTLPADPERVGYTFAGWFEDVADEATEFTATSILSEDKTVTAKWTINSYTVAYSIGYAEGEAITAATVEYDKTVSALPTPAKRAGYYFVGWYVKEGNAITNKQFTASTKVTENITVEAKWEAVKALDYLFIGASTLTPSSNWYTYEAMFGSLKAENLSIPGSRVENWIEKLEELGEKYAPAKIIMHIGMNNINDADESDEKVQERLQQLFGGLKEKFPNAQLYYISIIPNVLFSTKAETTKSVNTWAKETATTEYGIAFIDVAGKMPNSESNMVWFGTDGLHLSVDGYGIFQREIAEALGVPYTKAAGALGDMTATGAPEYGHTAGWVAEENDIWHNEKTGPGVAKLYISNAYGADVYGEAKVSVKGMYNGEVNGKAGLAISSPTVTYFFYINLSQGANPDGKWDDNYGAVGYRVETKGSKDWVYPETKLEGDTYFRPLDPLPGDGYVNFGAGLYDYNVNPNDYKTLAIAKVGKTLYFFSGGKQIGKIDDSMFAADEAVTISVLNFNTDMYAKDGVAITGADEVNAKIEEINYVPPHVRTLDGSLSDWDNKELANSYNMPGVDGSYAKIYAAMDTDSVYVYYDVYHKEHISTDSQWHLNTNAEFRLGSNNFNFYASANGALGGGLTTQDVYMHTSEKDSQTGFYHTVIEIAINYDLINGYDANSASVPGGFAFRIGNVKLNAWATDNGVWWYMPETDPNTPRTPITKDGILAGSERKVDGLTADWDETKFVASSGTKEGASAQYATHLGADGVYGIIRISSKGIDINRNNTAGDWYLNTNIEFFNKDNGNKAGRIIIYGGKLYHTGYITNAAMNFVAGSNGAVDVLTIEFFIANEHLNGVNAETESVTLDFGGQLWSTGVQYTNDDGNIAYRSWQDYARSITITRETQA